jgi:hypothetical protein
MIAEALELIQSTAVDAHGVAVVPIELRNAKLLAHKGILSEHPTGIPARNHHASDLESLAAVVVDYGDKENSIVWHNGNNVVAVLDSAEKSYRDDKVSWTLTESVKWAKLTRDAPTARTHADFVRFIVQNLRDELDASAPGLLGIIRNLKFKSADEQTGNIQQGRESMGRQIEAEITGAGDLPETIIVRVRRWASLEYVGAIECLLVLDTHERKLSLRPLADQLEQAEHGAQSWLHEQLQGAVECPVYYGTP